MVTTKGTGVLSARLSAASFDAHKLTVVRHGLPERRPNAQNDAREDVLITGHQEQSGVLRILNVRSLAI